MGFEIVIKNIQQFVQNIKGTIGTSVRQGSLHLVYRCWVAERVGQAERPGRNRPEHLADQTEYFHFK